MKHTKYIGVVAGVCIATSIAMSYAYAADAMKPNMGPGQGMPQWQGGMMQGGQGQNMMQGQGGMMMQQGPGQNMMQGPGQGMSQGQGGMMNPGKMPNTMGQQMGSGMMMPGKPMGPMMGSGQFMGSGMMNPGMMQKMGSGMMQGAGQQQGGVDFLRGYIRTDLTADEKTALKAILDANKVTMEGLKQSMTPGTPPTEEQLAAIKSAQEQFISSLSPYIEASKLEAFKQSMTAMKSPMSGAGMMQNGMMQGQGMMDGQGMMQQNGMMNGQMGQQGMMPQASKSKYSLSEKTKTQLSAKLDSVPAEKQVEFFTALVAKIDMLLAKTKGEKAKTQLTEIQNIVQDKLDALTGNSEDSILDSLMN